MPQISPMNWIAILILFAIVFLTVSIIVPNLNSHEISANNMTLINNSFNW